MIPDSWIVGENWYEQIDMRKIETIPDSWIVGREEGDVRLWNAVGPENFPQVLVKVGGHGNQDTCYFSFSPSSLTDFDHFLAGVVVDTEG